VAGDVEQLELRASGDATRIELRVKPRASRSQVLGVREGLLDVAVAAPPVDGEANAAIIELLAKVLHVARRDLSLVLGQASRTKVVEVAGLAPDEVRARLEGGRR
jgi:uncharacterized protein (TIGR00251 family)